MCQSTEATRKIFMAGSFMLALFPRVEAADFSDNFPISTAYNPAERLHLLPTSGTLGAGWEYRYDLSDSVKLLFAYTSMDYSQSDIHRSIDYDLNLKMVSRPVILDWHPFEGVFRTSAGMLFGGPRLTGTAHSVDTVTIGGQTVTGSDVQQAMSGIDPTQVFTVREWSVSGAEVIQYAATINSNDSLTVDNVPISARDFGNVSVVARYPNYAPYFGFGWGNINTRKGNWLYSIDIGVMCLGRPKVELSLNGLVADLTDNYYSAETRAQLAEEQQKIEASLSKYRYFPVFSISLWHRF